jgi:hypothetical protein
MVEPGRRSHGRWPSPALRFEEDVDRDRLLAAVRLRHRGDADVGVRLDVGERSLDEVHHPHVVRHVHGQRRAVARLDGQRVAVDLLDLPANAHRRLLLLLRHRFPMSATPSPAPMSVRCQYPILMTILHRSSRRYGIHTS